MRANEHLRLGEMPIVAVSVIRAQYGGRTPLDFS